MRKLINHLMSGYGALFFIFLYAPVILVVAYSFNSNPVNVMIWKEFSFDWYINLFGGETNLSDSSAYVESTDQLFSALKVSLTVAAFATVVSTVLGTSVAVAIARYRFRLQGFYRLLLMVPMVMPDIVLGIALLIFFVGVGMNLGVTSIVIGHCTFLTSYIFIVVSARLAGMNPMIESASADLGANEWQTFRRVTLPLILPGVIGGALLSFIISMDDLVITYFISGVDSTTLPVFIMSMIRRGIKPEINAIATMMLMASVLIASAGIYFKSRKA
ncbi:ABC transporter permease [Marinobacterium mangrovicola]|uniref:Spermidine/putrescine transport system permease protein n=1 Tax=Marinobacterium mangrovicola TaxID=1476959 RepID=A0A4R1GKQ6_9GAMM|nr:ABC transporter permease [Marinobacterium mangrovicola]TCK09027.1 spermidine/putrescine transport system permease protein [Marinobacterium mangrovicola]